MCVCVYMYICISTSCMPTDILYVALTAIKTMSLLTFDSHNSKESNELVFKNSYKDIETFSTVTNQKSITHLKSPLSNWELHQCLSMFCCTVKNLVAIYLIQHYVNLFGEV